LRVVVAFFGEQEKRERLSLRREEVVEHWHEFQGKV
jgi:hypothetical protein